MLTSQMTLKTYHAVQLLPDVLQLCAIAIKHLSPLFCCQVYGLHVNCV